MSERRMISAPASSLERDLLRSWEDERAPAEARERAMRHAAAIVGAATVSTVGATGLANGLGAAAKGAWWLSLAKGLTVLALAGATVYSVVRVTTDPPLALAPPQELATPPHQSQPSSPPVAEERIAQIAQIAPITPIAPPAPEPRVAEARAPAPTPLPLAAAAKTRPVRAAEKAADVADPKPSQAQSGAASVASSKPAPRLGPELTLLGEARAAITSRDFSRAIVLLDTFDHRYPSSVLEAEAAVLRMDTLAARGDRAKARELARDFVERRPRSPYVERVTSIRDAP